MVGSFSIFNRFEGGRVRARRAQQQPQIRVFRYDAVGLHQAAGDQVSAS